ncbi:MAG: hypothetical protein IH598_17695, partial [Bacteroidales bacterium]|nr:hypothetical protein [Bacteroidales bacterium]
PGFAQTYQTFERTLTLRQRSKSAMQNYGRSITKVAIFFIDCAIGFLSSRRKATELPELQGKQVNNSTAETIPVPKLTWQEVCRQRLKSDPEVCPCCQTGKMKTIEVILPRSPPAAINIRQKALQRCAV